MDRLLDVPFDRLHVRPRRVAAVHVAVQLGQLLVVPENMIGCGCYRGREAGLVLDKDTG